MPFFNIKLAKSVFFKEQKHITEVTVRFEGSEAFREAVWALNEELHRGGSHTGGRPFQGSGSFMATLGRSKKIFPSISGSPKAAQKFAALPAKGAS